MTDSREQLEADINRYLSQAGTDELVTKWLDRQAAITRAECRKDQAGQCRACAKEAPSWHC